MSALHPIELGALAAFAIIVMLFGAVWATGSTFGQRCERYLPDASELELAACVEYLSAGNPVSGLAPRAALESNPPLSMEGE